MFGQATVMRQVALVLGLGCLLGCLLWLAVGRLGRPAVPTESVVAAGPAPPQVSIADALSMPVFASQQAQGVQPIQVAAPVAQSSIRLLGISFTPRRRAAFVSTGGQPFWLAVGESRDGVTLTALRRSVAVLQINGAAVQLELFKRSVASSPDQGPAAAGPAPRGLEPASAPSSANPPATPPPVKSEPVPPKGGGG